jgi:hypothetical protein
MAGRVEDSVWSERQNLIRKQEESGLRTPSRASFSRSVALPQLPSSSTCSSWNYIWYTAFLKGLVLVQGTCTPQVSRHARHTHGMQRSGGGAVSREINVNSRRPLIPNGSRFQTLIAAIAVTDQSAMLTMNGRGTNYHDLEVAGFEDYYDQQNRLAGS